MKQEKMYTEKELVVFGNYLLSEKRNNTIIHPHVNDKVNDADIRNWQVKK